MLVAPRPGFQYRRTDTKELVPVDGFEADPTHLDIARALDCGDLVPVSSAKSARAAARKDPAQ